MRGIDAAHLTGADAHGRAISRVDDRVRFHMFSNRECEQKIGDFGIRRLPFCDDFEIGRSGLCIVSALQQEPASDLLDRPTGRCRVGQDARQQQPEVLAFGEKFQRVLVSFRGDDDLYKQIAECSYGRCVE